MASERKKRTEADTRAEFVNAVERDTAIDFELKRYNHYDQACVMARDKLMAMLRERSNVISKLVALTYNGKQSGARFTLDDTGDEYRISTYRPVDESGNPTGEKILYFRRVFKLGQPIKMQLDGHVTPYAPKCE